MSIPAFAYRNDSGRVKIEEGFIFWKAESQNLLKVAVADIRIIGEYTTAHALHKNEWFVVFVFANEDMFQMSMYAQGMTEVLEELSQKLETEFTPLLENEREYKSNVIWPLEIAGQDLYELRIKESKTLFDRFRARLGFGNPIELILTDQVKATLS